MRTPDPCAGRMFHRLYFIEILPQPRSHMSEFTPSSSFTAIDYACTKSVFLNADRTISTPASARVENKRNARGWWGCAPTDQPSEKLAVHKFIICLYYFALFPPHTAPQIAAKQLSLKVASERRQSPWSIKPQALTQQVFCHQVVRLYGVRGLGSWDRRRGGW